MWELRALHGFAQPPAWLHGSAHTALSGAMLALLFPQPHRGASLRAYVDLQVENLQLFGHSVDHGASLCTNLRNLGGGSPPRTGSLAHQSMSESFWIIILIFLDMGTE